MCITRRCSVGSLGDLNQAKVISICHQSLIMMLDYEGNISDDSLAITASLIVYAP